MSETTRFCVAETPEERKQAYQLRYRIFVEELNYQIPGSNAEEGLAEPSDESADIFLAYDNDVPVATLALNRWSEGELSPEDIEHFQLNHFASHFTKSSIAIVRKALVSRDYRGTPLFLQLVSFGFQHAIKPGLQFLFLDCSPFLVRYYQRFGYRTYAPYFTYDHTGLISVPLCLVLGDHAYLEKLESPVLWLLHAGEHSPSPEATNYFNKHWTLSTPRKSTPETEPLAREFANLPDEVQRYDWLNSVIFQDLPREQIEHFLSRCEKINFSAKEHLIRTAEGDRHLLLLSEGYVSVMARHRDKEITLSTQGPGHLIGELAFLLGVPRTADVMTLTKGVAYRVMESTIQELLAESPNVAAILYRNLSRVLAERLRVTSLWLTESPPV